MSDEYKQSPRIEQVNGNVTYNQHEYHYPGPPTNKSFRPGKWGWIGGLVALVLGLGGILVTTQLNAQTVYYCASHNTVKYHTDATCAALTQCGSRVKSMHLGQARSKMELCKMCH
jgi:hypothetical protein